MLIAIIKDSNQTVQRLILSDALGGRLPPAGYSLVVADESVHKGYIYNPVTQTFSYGGMVDDYDILLLPTQAAMAAYRAGSMTFSLVTLVQNITFSAPMADTNYQVFFQPSNGVTLSTTLTISNKTINGFRATLSVGVVVTLGWLAVPNM